MALIAASIGAVLHYGFGIPLPQAGSIALALLFAFVAIEACAARRHDRADFADRFEGLARAAAEIARGVGEVRHRLAALEAMPMPDPKAAAEPLAREIAALADLAESLARSVAAHDAALAAREEILLPAAFGRTPEPAASAPARSTPVPNGPLGGKTEVEIRAIVQQALEAGRVELYLQPVVTLPQRKVRYYEALSRMRITDDIVVDAARFLPAARAAGLLPVIDERLVHGCVQIVRRLAAKNRDVGLFLNIAPETLVDRPVFSEILGYLEANRALAPSLVIELAQSTYRTLGAAELNSLAQLAERGFRFSLDRIEDFRIDPRGLSERGVRFVKVSADLLLNQTQTGGGHVHPADLSDLLGRHGIELAADHIESEHSVVDLLDLDVRYGQGFLFAQPRPVRAEVLHSEREVVVETAPPLALAADLARPPAVRDIIAP